MPNRGSTQCRDLDDLVQRGYDTNFNVDVVSCRFTGFNRDGKYAKIMQNIIELPYSPHMIKMLEMKQRHLLAVIVPPLGRITSQMTNVTNQNLKV
jgi:hypothetical protein